MRDECLKYDYHISCRSVYSSVDNIKNVLYMRAECISYDYHISCHSVYRVLEAHSRCSHRLDVTGGKL